MADEAVAEVWSGYASQFSYIPQEAVEDWWSQVRTLAFVGSIMSLTLIAFYSGEIKSTRWFNRGVSWNIYHLLYLICCATRFYVEHNVSRSSLKRHVIE